MTHCTPKPPEGMDSTTRVLARAIYLVVAMAALGAGLVAPVPVPSAFASPPDSRPPSINTDDDANFRMVDSQFYCGGRPRASAFPKLVQLGIRTIINLESGEDAEVERAAIEKLNLGLQLDRRIQLISFPIGSEEIDETGVSHKRLQELFTQIRDAKRPILIHCYHGRDRTGAVIAIYRMLMSQKSATEAFEEAYHYGFSREVHGLSKTVDRYKSAKKLQSLPRPEPDK